MRIMQVPRSLCELLMKVAMLHCKTPPTMLQCSGGFDHIVVSLQITLPCSPSPLGWGSFFCNLRWSNSCHLQLN